MCFPVLDATAKIPSGLLQGNCIQLGDFDQCLGSRARVQLDTGTVVKVSHFRAIGIVVRCLFIKKDV